MTTHLTTTTASVTRWLDYVSYFGHLGTATKELHNFLAKVYLKLCPSQNKLAMNCQSLLKFRQSGKISPNLVTMTAIGPVYLWSSRHLNECNF